METIKAQLERVAANVTLKPTEPTLKPVSAKQRQKLADTWQILLSRRLVTDPVGSDAHLVFERDMSDLTVQQLDMGLKKSRDIGAFRNGWFSTPAFRELCQVTAKDLGLPDSKLAMNEFCAAGYPKADQVYSHEAVYLAGMAVGLRNMEHMTEAELFPLYDQAYDVLVKRVMAGEDLKRPVPKALPEHVLVPCTKEQAVAGIRKVREMFMPVLDIGDTFQEGKHAGNTVRYVLENDGSFLRAAIKTGSHLFTENVHKAVLSNAEVLINHG